MEILKPAIHPTNFIQAPALSALLGTKIIFADETKQHTGSFKFRAAYNVAAKVPNKHILAASSGNFAQALAYACSLLDKHCTIVMPAGAPQTKIAGVKKYGGKIELVDTNKKSRADRLKELAQEYPEAYCTNAYDNPLIIDGNKSLGEEIAAYSISKGKLDYIIAPIGGGGLISGIISGAGEAITVIGAEPAMANDAARSLKAGELIANELEPPTIADGARTISLGKHNWEILRHNLKQIVEVSEEQIRAAMRLIYDHLQIKAEPTGALTLGAVLAQPALFEEKHICCLISGGNVDQNVFEELIQ